MKSVQRVVDFFREQLREISDDSVYTDEFLYEILNMYRAELLYQSLSGGKDLSPWLYQRFCVKLCPSNFIECSCTPFDFQCKVYKSENPIPKPIWNGSTSIINISELYGNEGNINEVNERSFRLSQFRKYKSKYYYYIGDWNGAKHLFILSNEDYIPPKYIKIEGVFEDPTSIEELACINDECPNPLGNGFPIDLHKESALFKLAFDHLKQVKTNTEDRTNNAESTPKQQQI